MFLVKNEGKWKFYPSAEEEAILKLPNEIIIHIEDDMADLLTDDGWEEIERVYT